jgi:hypothetical protein
MHVEGACRGLFQDIISAPYEETQKNYVKFSKARIRAHFRTAHLTHTNLSQQGWLGLDSV